ncbi:uncharacterized protein BXZ73DRAFT_2438, partial [Epithele typhae]|uniref:uncharacterized protein n=1 Tax=Epithele typhae TaxID=378194 RepID=UPI002007AA21
VVSWISTSQQREHAWQLCTTTLERHYEEKIKRWNAELDMLLVFAGLFSTALTAFIVQSYPLLQPADTDTIIFALAQMSSQLDSYTVSTSFVNSTVRTLFRATDGDTGFKAPLYAIWVNGLWFSSLICTLSASSIAVLVKQWLHQYGQSLSGTTQEASLLRQYRHESMLRWHVSSIIAVLPILLQTALALFLGGLLILLWNLHRSVAIVATVLVSILLSFTVATTLLPIIYTDCCFQSPQALSLFIFTQTVAHLAWKLAQAVEQWTRNAAMFAETASWSSLHYTLLASAQNAATSVLAWLGPAGRFRTWQARERPAAASQQVELEQALALTSYYVTANPALLNTTLLPCLMDMSPALSDTMSARYGALVRELTEKLPSGEWSSWRPVLPFVLVVLSMMTSEPGKGTVRRVLRTMPAFPRASVQSKLSMLYLRALAQLVGRRLAAREAFQRLVTYLESSQIGSDKQLVFEVDVLEDVEATFPSDEEDIEALLDLDDADAIACYFTALAETVRYLLLHRARLARSIHAAPVRARVRALLSRFGSFLLAPPWRSRVARQRAVLRALDFSRLPELVRELHAARSTRDLVSDHVVGAFRGALGTFEEGCMR